MFKCVFIIIFLYLHIQTATAHHKNFAQKMVYVKYRNPYKASRCCGGFVSGVRGPGQYVFEGNRLKISGGGSKRHYKTSTTRALKKHHKTSTTAEPRRQETPSNDEAVGLRSLESTEKVIGLKVASIFRNNLITVFGYILHRPGMELNSQLYTSLYFILSTIKLNQVNILSMVPILEGIAFKNSNGRFLKIFEAMEAHLPIYLACAATFWKEAIKSEEVNLNNILKPYANGPLKVDVMEGLNVEMLNMVKIDAKIDILNVDETQILYDFNINMVQIMRHIKQQKNETQQIFFGSLLLFFPRSYIQPDVEESIQLLTEFLEQNELEEWTIYFNDLNATRAGNPYFMVNHILHKLLVNDNISFVIKESIQIILSNLRNRNPTAINPHYNSIANLVTLDGIKITYMLQYISNVVYPIEIVISGMRLAYYLKHNYIRSITLFAHFNPYFYSSPTEILIALLDRIIKRQPDLPAEILNSAGAVYSYVTFAYRYITFPVVMPDDLLNPNILFMSLRAPDIEQSIVKTVDMVISMLQIPGLSFEQILLERPMYKCATPSLCFLDVLKFIQANIPSPELIALITILFKSSCCTGNCPLQEPPSSNDSSLFPSKLIPINESYIYFFNTSILVTTVETTLPPSEGPISSPNTLKSTAATPPTTIRVDDAIIPQVTESMLNNATAMLNIVEELSLQGEDVSNVRRILQILQSQYSKEFTKLKKSTHTLLITGILIYLDKVKAMEDIDSAVRKYVNIFFTKLKHVENVLKVITTEKEPTRPILARLIVAVPAPMENETEIFHQLSLLLRKEELFNLIEKNLERGSYKNIGTFLQAIINQELKLEGTLSDQETKAAKYYANKIQMYGFGQGKIEWGVDVDVISRKINIAQIMDNAIGFKKLNNEERVQFNGIITYLKTNPPILQNWDKWIYYSKCGDFTKALFNLLLNHASLPTAVRKSVQSLTPDINYDKTGSKVAF